MMIRNFVKVALRNLRLHPGFSMLNVAGLATGMACCIVIALYVRDELTYDRFLPDSDRTYRVALDLSLQDLAMQTAYTPRPLGPALASDFPEVESATRLWYDPAGKMVVRHADHVFAEPRVFYADSTFFDVLGVPLLQGAADDVLRDPFSIVLTESTARKYFGDANPLGQVLHVREPSDRDVFDYKVTGVMADIPSNSHLAFDFLASYSTQRQSLSQSWLGFGVYSYLKLRQGANAQALESKMPALFARHGGPQIQEAYGTGIASFEASGNYYRYFLQPVTTIHLHSNLQDEIKPTSDARLVYMFAIIAVFILIVAGINFVNLSTARAARRSMEVGIRKALGSQRSQLIMQFLSEAVILSVFGLLMALAVVYLALPYFNTMTGKELTLSFSGVATAGALLLGLGLIVGLAAGAYPAWYISAFSPAAVMKLRRSRRGHRRLRDILVVVQFATATTLIACTGIVSGQMQYMQSKNLGFDAEQVVVLEGAEVLGPQGEAFRQTLSALPGVVRVTNSEQVPGRHFDGSTFKLPEEPDDSAILLEYTYASYDYVETLGLQLEQGRSLSRDFPTDSLAVLLNETAVRRLGLDDPVGRQLDWPGESVYTIVGVLKDFHIASLHREIGPIALLGPDPRNTNRPNLLVTARIESQDWQRTIEEMASVWARFAPQSPFIYSFLDDTFRQLYAADKRTSQLIWLFAMLAILIACFGLFGLAAHMAEQRKKEIGVRKVFGASEGRLVARLSLEFTRPVLVAIVIALPLAYFVMMRWLESFAFAVELGPGIFLAAGGVSLLIAWSAVSYQSIIAARANPIVALRSE